MIVNMFVAYCVMLSGLFVFMFVLFVCVCLLCCLHFLCEFCLRFMV